jgi:hypothetical protein
MSRAELEKRILRLNKGGTGILKIGKTMGIGKHERHGAALRDAHNRRLLGPGRGHDRADVFQADNRAFRGVQQCRLVQNGRSKMIRLIAIAGFALAVNLDQ